jgi:hypothetical protein
VPTPDKAKGQHVHNEVTLRLQVVDSSSRVDLIGEWK